jgi:hypothetical protein
VLDYVTYLRLLKGSGYENGLVMHSLSEADTRRCVEHIRRAEEAGGG